MNFRQRIEVHIGDIVHSVLIQLAGELIGVEILEGSSGTQRRVAGEVIQITVIGIIAAQAGSIGTIWTANLIEHTVIQRVQHLLRGTQRARAQAGQMAEVHHVGVALFPGIAAVVFALGRRSGKLGEEGGIVARQRQRLCAEDLVGVQQRTNLGKIGEGQGGVILRPHSLTAAIVGVADDFAKRRTVHGGLLRQCAYPLGIVPAVGRLRFLRGHQIMRDIGKCICHVYRSHQAGVKAHQFQGLTVRRGRPYIRERLVHLVQRQGVIVIQLIEGRAGHAAAAMVPEYNSRALGGIVFLGKAQEVLQRVLCAHAGGGLLVHQ